MDGKAAKVAVISRLEELSRGPSAELELRLTVKDPEVVAELSRHFEGVDRDQYALAAMRLGVLALRAATGQVDGAAIKDAGRELVSEIRDLLSGRASELMQSLKGALSQYLDPQSGLLQQRLQNLLAKDGELERVLHQHLGPEDSQLAKTLAHALGDQSPVFKMLSPTEANGLRGQLAQTLEVALTEQRTLVLAQFSLDAKDSALSRLVAELREHQAKVGNDLTAQVGLAVKEFSLDDEGSGLSRLVRKVEAAQKAIVEEFSQDNDASALNKLSRLLTTTSDTIAKNLTLDDEASSLSRLRRELLTQVDTLTRKNDAFHSEVKETLSALKARKAESHRSTTHGLAFEARVGERVFAEAERAADVPEATGNSPGHIARSKKGDFVVELGRESPAPGARVVWEAKEVEGYSLTKALAELDEARKNRGAQVGVFVFSRRCAPEGLGAFTRHGMDLVVTWDAEDGSTDVFLHAAASVARALVIRTAQKDAQTDQAVLQVERATRAIEKQAAWLEELKTTANTARVSCEKIIYRTQKMQTDLGREVLELDEALASIKVGAVVKAG